MGAGNDGDVTIWPSDIDFDTVTVGFNKVLTFTVDNKSKTNIYVEFFLEQQGIDEENWTEKDRVNEIVSSNFSFDFNKGVINGLSKWKVKITFKPTCWFEFNLRLCCNARENAVKELMASMWEKNFMQ